MMALTEKDSARGCAPLNHRVAFSRVVLFASIGGNVPAFASAAEGFTVTASGTWWHPWIGGTISITRGGQPGSATTIDVSKDLGLGGADSGAGELVLGYDRHRFSFGYQPLGFDGDATVRRPFVFHGTTYATGERVHSHLDLDLWTPAYEYALIERPFASLSAGPGAVVWSFDASLSGSGPGGALAEQRNFTHILPTLGAEAAEPLRAVMLYQRLAIGVVGSDRYEVDAQGGGAVRAGEHVGVEVGYRWLKFRFHESTNVGDLSFAGPAVTLAVHF
jgi:hypothetical protein